MFLYSIICIGWGGGGGLKVSLQTPGALYWLLELQVGKHPPPRPQRGKQGGDLRKGWEYKKGGQDLTASPPLMEMDGVYGTRHRLQGSQAGQIINKCT